MQILINSSEHYFACSKISVAFQSQPDFLNWVTPAMSFQDLNLVTTSIGQELMMMKINCFTEPVDWVGFPADTFVRRSQRHKPLKRHKVK